ncbi:MAG: hypothetical protein JXQ71_09325 [Verrucomicrobia bacterium]|nr:hypothetical protein [Verrucomicrobiota bacterium]
MQSTLRRCLRIALCSLLAHAALPAQGAPPAPAPDALPAAVDLRPAFDRHQLGPRRQGTRPTCSVFVVAGAIEFALAQGTGQGGRLSVEFLNWAANQVCGEREDGGFFSDLWKGFEAHGICGESHMPYQASFDPERSPGAEALTNARARRAMGLRLHWIKEWNVTTGLTEKQLEDIKRTLSRGWPVCSGLRWPKHEQWIGGVLQMCPPGAVRDGHSVLLAGYRDDSAQPSGGVLLFRNPARNGRDGSMPYAYAQAYMNDAAWVDASRQHTRRNHRPHPRPRVDSWPDPVGGVMALASPQPPEATTNRLTWGRP